MENCIRCDSCTFRTSRLDMLHDLGIKYTFRQISILTSVEVAWNPHPHMSTHDNLVCVRAMYVICMSVNQGIYFPDVVIYLQSNCWHISSLSLSCTLHLNSDGRLIYGPQGRRPPPALSLNTLSICADSFLVYCIVNSLFSHFSDIFQ